MNCYAVETICEQCTTEHDRQLCPGCGWHPGATVPAAFKIRVAAQAAMARRFSEGSLARTPQAFLDFLRDAAMSPPPTVCY